jgi:hypothetical protein
VKRLPTLLAHVMRAALFTLVGVVFFVHWILTDPTHGGSKSIDEWNFVLGFSAILLLLAFAVPLFAQLVGGKTVFRVSLVPAAGLVFASLSNVLEDGLGMDRAFFGVVLGTGSTVLGLLVLTAVTAFGGRGGYRLLALIPAGTMAAVIFYVIAGGILMLTTWLAAAALALALPTRALARTSLTTR